MFKLSIFELLILNMITFSHCNQLQVVRVTWLMSSLVFKLVLFRGQ